MMVNMQDWPPAAMVPSLLVRFLHSGLVWRVCEGLAVCSVKEHPHSLYDDLPGQVIRSSVLLLWEPNNSYLDKNCVGLTTLMGILWGSGHGVRSCFATAALCAILVADRMVFRPSSLITMDAPGWTLGPFRTAWRSSFTFQGVTGWGYVSFVAKTWGRTDITIIFIDQCNDSKPTTMPTPGQLLLHSACVSSLYCCGKQTLIHKWVFFPRGFVKSCMDFSRTRGDSSLIWVFFCEF